MNKPHPKTKVLVERQDRHLWRVVERTTTRRGLSSDIYKLIEANIPEYGRAKIVFDQLKA